MAHLRKLIMVDSYSASRIREIRLDGHVHVSGRNGRGKTTLIRLIPLFYGEQPSKLVRSSGSVVRSLREFMFSRSTSYVAFEYENHEGVKLAILHYGSDNSPQYHLADGPYAREIFVEDGNLLEGGQLYRRLRMLGRNPSGALGVLQYRAIIQGTGTRLTAAEHRHLLRRFALVASRSRLAGIERISSGMFSKDITFVALKRMATSVAYDDEEEKKIVLNLSRKELEGFLPDFNAYRAVMALEPIFQAANSAYVQALAARRQQALAAGRLKRLVLALGEWMQACRDKEVVENDALSALQRERRELIAAFEQDRQTLAHEIERLNREIEQADREERDWLAKDIHALADLVGRRAGLEAEAQRLAERQGMLLHKADSVSRKYQALLAQETTRRNQLQADAQTRLNEAIADLNQQVETLNKEQESVTLALEEEQAVALTVVDGAWQAAVDAVSEIDRMLAHMEPDAALQAQVETAERAVEQADDDAKQAAQGEGEAKLAEAHRAHELESRNQATNRLTQKHVEADSKLNHLLSLESPGQDTLLHYLRRQLPEWHGNIAKVIREDLLLRQDLAPGLADDDDSLYGLRLDLAKIETGRAASEQSLAMEIERARQIEAAARKSLEEAQAAQRAATLGLEAARELLRERGAARTETDAALAQARQLLTAACCRRDEELGERRAQWSARRAEAKSVADARKTAAEELRRSQQAAKRSLKEGFEARRSGLRTQQQQAKNRHADEMKELQAARQKAMDGLEKLRLAELADAGVDTVALQTLEGQLAEARAMAQRAADAAPQVEGYRRWLALVPQQRERNRDLRRQKMDESQTLQHRHTEALEQIKVRIDRQESVLQQAKEAASDAAARLVAAETAQQARLAGIVAEASDEANDIARHWLLPELLTALDQATKALAHHDRLLRQSLGTLVKTFRRPDFSVTKVGEYALHLADDYLADPVQSLDVFADWYGTAHAQHRDILAGALRNGCGILRRFHDGLLEFQSNITGLSRELQAGLTSDMVFDAIRSLTLRLSAQVDRRLYWDSLCSVLSEHDRWQESGFVDLPGEALLQELQNFARHIPEDSLAEHPETLMDIEIEVDDGTELKRVRNEADLKQVSSNGLSYLVLCLVFVAFANRARRNAAELWLSWALDEIGTIDEGNARALIDMLNRNRIRLISASPENKESLQTLFNHRYEVLPGFEIRRILNDDELPVLQENLP